MAVSAMCGDRDMDFTAVVEGDDPSPLRLACAACGDSAVVSVSQMSLAEVDSGRLQPGQALSPSLTRDERDWLVSGLCPSCYESDVVHSIHG